MYPESLKIDFNIDRAGIIQKLINTNSNDANLKTTFLVDFSIEVIIIYIFLILNIFSTRQK